MAVSIRELDDDAALVLAVQAGDSEAFGELFRRHYPSVRRACARRLRDMSEADEVAQAAFVRAYERIDRCGGERRFGAWVQVIAQRLCIDSMRSRARTTPQEEPIRADRAVGPNLPEEQLLRQQRASDVHTALKALPPRQRKVVIARDIEERRPGEIAAALGLSIGAVDSLLLRARRRLALAYRATSNEQGVASAASSATLATTAVAAYQGPIVRLAAAVVDGIRDAVVQVSMQLGLIPGASEAGRHSILAAAASVAIAVSSFTAAPPQADTPSAPAPVVELPPQTVEPPVITPPQGPPAPVVPDANELTDAVVSGLPVTAPEVPDPAIGDPEGVTSAPSSIAEQMATVPLVGRTTSNVLRTVDRVATVVLHSTGDVHSGR